MFHLSCVKHYLQNALFCLSQPSKRYLVRIAKKTVFLDKRQKKNCVGQSKHLRQTPSSSLKDDPSMKHIVNSISFNPF